MIITIDGPTASGKSTVARLLARELGFYYIASGMIYRALAYVLLAHYGYAIKTLNQSAQKDAEEILDYQNFEYSFDNGQEKIFFKGLDITSHLKSPEIDAAASIMSTNQDLRKLLFEFQRHLASNHNSVCEGRDCGSVVFPDAEYKFFLTASSEIRAQRWQKLQQKLGVKLSLEQAKKIIEERDVRDSQREFAPLMIPDHAIIIDCSNDDAQTVVKNMRKLISK